MLTDVFASKIAAWLLKDIEINEVAASSTHMYEPPFPESLTHSDLQETND